MKRSFVFTSDGDHMTWDLDEDFRSYGEEIRRTLDQMGELHWTIVLWALPEGDDSLLNSDAEYDDAVEYLQAAGTAQEMTIELQRREADGVLRHYILGYTPPVTGEPELDINWARGTKHVTIAQSEAFNVDTAFPIFQHYFHHQDLPEGTPLRLLPEFVG